MMIKAISDYLYESGFNVYRGRVHIDDNTSFLLVNNGSNRTLFKPSDNKMNANLQLVGYSSDYDELQDENFKIIRFLNKKDRFIKDKTGFLFFDVQQSPFELGLLDEKYTTSLNFKVIVEYGGDFNDE